MKHLLFLFLFSPILAFAQADKDKPTHYLTFSSGLTFGHRQVVTRFPDMRHHYNITNLGGALALGWEYHKNQKQAYTFNLQYARVAMANEKYKKVVEAIPSYDYLKGEPSVAVFSASAVLKRRVVFFDVLAGAGLDFDLDNIRDKRRGVPKVDSTWIWESSRNKDKLFVYSEASLKRGVILNPFVVLGINKDIQTGKRGKLSFSLMYQKGFLRTHSLMRSYIDNVGDGVLYTSKINFRGSNTRFMLTYAHQIDKRANKKSEKVLKPEQQTQKDALRNKLYFELGIGANYGFSRTTQAWPVREGALSKRANMANRQLHIGITYRKSSTSPWAYQFILGHIAPCIKMAMEAPLANGLMRGGSAAIALSYKYAAMVSKRHLGKNWWLEGGLALAWNQPLTEDVEGAYGYRFPYPDTNDNIIFYLYPKDTELRDFNLQTILGISKAIRFSNKNELFFNFTYQKGLLDFIGYDYMYHYEKTPSEQFIEKHIFRGTVLRASVGYRVNLAKKR